MKTPAAADRRSVLAKYGTKFAALAGVAATVPKAAPAVPKAPTVPKAPPVAPPPGAPTATMEEAWAALNEAQTGKAADAIEKMWFDTIARLFPNKSNTDLKPHEWGKLKAEFKDEIPM
jgi:hypothetical protein